MVCAVGLRQKFQTCVNVNANNKDYHRYFHILSSVPSDSGSIFIMLLAIAAILFTEVWRLLWKVKDRYLKKQHNPSCKTHLYAYTAVGKCEPEWFALWIVFPSNLVDFSFLFCFVFIFRCHNIFQVITGHRVEIRTWVQWYILRLEGNWTRLKP